MNGRIRSWWKLAAVVVTVGTLVFLSIVLHFGSALAKPTRQAAGPIPEYPPLEAVTFPSESGAQLKGWLARREGDVGGVVLLHGIRANRHSMLARAHFLYDAGYSVLLIDLQAHGESSGDTMTFGFLEALDASSSVAFLRQRLPGEPIAAIGSSLGGAACVLGSGPLDVDALVLESVYPDIRQAVRDRLRLRFGHTGAWLAPLLTLQIKPRLGIDVNSLRPVVSIANSQAPVLIIAGELDQRTTVADSQRLFDAAPEPKQLWVVPGVRHVDLHRHAGPEYEKRILRFLEIYLKGTG